MTNGSCSSNHADYLRDTGSHLHIRQQKEVITNAKTKMETNTQPSKL